MQLGGLFDPKGETDEGGVFGCGRREFACEEMSVSNQALCICVRKSGWHRIMTKKNGNKFSKTALGHCWRESKSS